MAGAAPGRGGPVPAAGARLGRGAQRGRGRPLRRQQPGAHGAHRVPGHTAIIDYFLKYFKRKNILSTSSGCQENVRRREAADQDGV